MTRHLPPPDIGTVPGRSPEAAFDAVRACTKRSGGFYYDLPDHLVVYLPQGETPRAQQRLVITYDNLASRRELTRRMPWGHSFLEKEGYDILGVLAKRNIWFRDPLLFERLEALSASGFFGDFAAVSAFGSSMGGYGALAFASLYPDATVLAFAPQSSLARKIVPFERRYPYARKQGNWSGAYRDAAQGAAHAARSYILYDPYELEDAAHAARLAGPRAQLLRLPNHSHKLPPALKQMGRLKDVVRAGLTGTLDTDTFYQMMRDRRTSVAYLADLLEAARARGHYELGLRAARAALKVEDNWKLRKGFKALRIAAQAERAAARKARQASQLLGAPKTAGLAVTGADRTAKRGHVAPSSQI